MVRISHHDSYHLIKGRQRSRPYDRNNVYWRKAYRKTYCEYVIAELSWTSGQILELASYPTKREALQNFTKK